MDSFPSSPPLLPRDATEPPTSSSPPPVFSSDGPMEDADVQNYIQRRAKRKLEIECYELWGSALELERPKASSQPVTKKSRFTRNFDSGVWMASDDSAPANSDPPSTQSIQEMKSDTSPSPSFVQRVIKHHVSQNDTVYFLGGLCPTEEDLQHLSELNKVIRPPLDPGYSAPGSYFYRSMVPELHLELSDNKLKRMPPSVYQLEYLHTLILNDNDIQELHFPLANLKHLHLIDLRNNNLSSLPYDLLRPVLAGLNIHLSGNPLLQYKESSWMNNGKEKQLVGRSPLLYLDETGRAVQRAPMPILSETTRAPSLFSLSITQSLKHASVDEIKHLLGDSMPPEVLTVLDTAGRNEEESSTPLKTCQCGREYVIARAEWCEFWRIRSAVPIPFKRQVCSWHCVAPKDTIISSDYGPQDGQ